MIEAAQRAAAPVRNGARDNGTESISFPGGNTAILRAMLRNVIPGSLPGPNNLETIIAGPLDFAALDRLGQPVRMKLSATVVRVEHDGPPDSAASVFVTYEQGGKLRRVRAKTVIMAAGGWVCRRVIRDLGEAHAEAYGKLNYGPALTINVAVRNWRFIDKLGISAARWFKGLGWHVTVRRNMQWTAGLPTLTPDSPVVLTFYIPVLFRGQPANIQGSLARQQILGTPYADYERQIRQQMTEMFGPSGFDARRDIAGIVVNRWGHCFSAPPPGFLYAQDGSPSPRDILRRPFGRIHFAHSELSGRMNMMNAMNEANRAVEEARSLL
jgi:spermidine dehydrogenase